MCQIGLLGNLPANGALKNLLSFYSASRIEIRRERERKKEGDEKYILIHTLIGLAPILSFLCNKFFLAIIYVPEVESGFVMMANLYFKRSE